ncbi:hypothetical protein JCM8208_006651 [Rhodotorula glutinis]
MSSSLRSCMLSAARRAPYVSPQEQSRSHRLRVRSFGGACSLDLRLPWNLDAFTVAGSTAPPIADLTSRFPPGARWTDLLTTSVVHRPALLWSTYGPRAPSGYRRVHDLWRHWVSGADAPRYDYGCLGAQLPPLELLEQRFGEDWWVKPGQQSRDDSTARRQMTTFMRVVRAIQRERVAAGPDASVDLAIKRLLVVHGGLEAKQVSKLAEALKLAETAAAPLVAQP